MAEDQELTPEEAAALQDPTKLQGANAADIAEKNKRLYARLQKEKSERAAEVESRKKFEEENKKLQEKLSALEKPPAPVSSSTPQTTLTVDDFIAFKAKGLSEGDIKALVDKAKNLGIAPQKLAEDPELFTPWHEARKSKAQAEQNTPSPSFGGKTASGKSWEDRGLTDAERKVMFDEMMSRGRDKSPF